MKHWKNLLHSRWRPCHASTLVWQLCLCSGQEREKKKKKTGCTGLVMRTRLSGHKFYLKHFLKYVKLLNYLCNFWRYLHINLGKARQISSFAQSSLDDRTWDKNLSVRPKYVHQNTLWFLPWRLIDKKNWRKMLTSDGAITELKFLVSGWAKSKIRGGATQDSLSLSLSLSFKVQWNLDTCSRSGFQQPQLEVK